MGESVFDQPSSEQLDAFVAGDPIAIDEVVRMLLPQVYRWALRHYSNLPEDEVKSIIHHVFAEVCRNHARYSHQRSKLTTYVIAIVRLRLNDLHQEIVLAERISESDVVEYEKRLESLYNLSDTVDATTQVARDTFFRDAAILLDDYEREILDLMRQGEKRQDTFVTVLHRYGYPVSEPSHAVKNVKERLIRRLRSIADETGYKLEDLLGG